MTETLDELKAMTNQRKCRIRDNHLTQNKTYWDIVAERDKEDERIDVIARNGNEGEHYEESED